MKTLIVTGMVALSSTFSIASPNNDLIGKFKGRGEGNVELSVKSTDKGLQTEIFTSEKGCTGGVEGIAQKVAPNTIRLSRRDDPDEPMCNITMVYHGNRVKVTSDGCLYFHGASCGFDAELTKKK